MTLLIILAVVFVAVALMVLLGERFGKPMTDEQQGKYSKITRILVFVVIITAIIKGASIRFVDLSRFKFCSPFLQENKAL